MKVLFSLLLLAFCEPPHADEWLFALLSPWTGAAIFEMVLKFTTIVTELSHGCAANIPQSRREEAAAGGWLVTAAEICWRGRASWHRTSVQAGGGEGVREPLPESPAGGLRLCYNELLFWLAAVPWMRLFSRRAALTQTWPTVRRSPPKPPPVHPQAPTGAISRPVLPRWGWFCGVETGQELFILRLFLWISVPQLLGLFLCSILTLYCV